MYGIPAASSTALEHFIALCYLKLSVIEQLLWL